MAPETSFGGGESRAGGAGERLGEAQVGADPGEDATGGVRAVALEGADTTVEIGGWQGFTLPVTATPAGVTYVIRLNREAGRMEVVSSEPPTPPPPPRAEEPAPADNKAAAEGKAPEDKPAPPKKNGEARQPAAEKGERAEKKDEGKAAEKDKK